ncbi:MAG: hypothetical protein Q8O92_10970 [Candidatus Latescibacter sp.]|nr:hypothetical protein [Candidatus Latescibacter sp.]
MKGIFDKRGEVVGWLGEEGADITIYSNQGNPKAFLKRDAVFTFNGMYLGTFKSGYFRDKNGNAVAFIEGALGDPPVPKIISSKIPPKPVLLPRPAIKGKLPVSPPAIPEWSAVKFDAFLGEGAAPQCACPI